MSPAQAIAEAMGLSVRKVRVAVRYYADYRAEVDDRIAAHRDAAREAEAARRAEQDCWAVAVARRDRSGAAG